jgi:hypothetical protein
MRTLRGKRSRLAVALLAVLGLVGAMLATTAVPASATDVEPTGLTVLRLTDGSLQVNAGEPNEQFFDLSPGDGSAACNDGVDNNDLPPLNVGFDGLIDYFKPEEALFNGTASGGSGTTLVDEAQSWAPNQWQGKSVWITGGQGDGQARRIASNTATTLTLVTSPVAVTGGALNPVPNATSTYAISTADPECTGPDDNSELVPGFQPVEGVVVVAEVAADGSLTIPKNVRASEDAALALGGIYFPPGYVPDAGISTGMITARFQPAPGSNVNIPATGTFDPDTGEITMAVAVRIKLEGGSGIDDLGNNCYIPSGSNGIALNFITGTTDPPLPNLPISGDLYDRRTGDFTVVNNSFAVGGAGSCGLLGFGNAQINAAFGLPAAAGRNAAIFSFRAEPKLNYLPVAPTSVAAIADAPFGHLAPEVTTLDGSGSFDHNEDEILSYAWTQTGGTPVTLMGADTAFPTYVGPLADDTLTFELVVGSRDQYLCPEPPAEPPLPAECELLYSDPDEVSVNHSYNTPPVADAGPDQGPLSVGLVTLDGTGSSDADNDVLSYSWTQISGPPVTLTNGSTATPSFLAASGPATFEFQLTVDDGFIGGTDTDTVSVEVIANQDPTADAGPDQLNRKSLQTVTLDGTGSTDPDNHELAYEWEQVSGHEVTLSDPTASQPDFVVPPAPDFVYPHSLVFELTVDDGFGGVDSDIVEIEVTASNPTVTVPTRDPAPGFSGDTITLSTNVTNPDGGDFTYQWVQLTGKTTPLSATDVANPTFIQPANGTNSAACTSGSTSSGPTGNNCPRYSVQVTNTETGAASNVANMANWAGQAPGRPIANPVQNGYIVVSGGTHMLDGTASSQAQGRALEFAWTQTGGDPVVLTGADTATPTFEAPDTVQTLTFELIVTDPLNPIISGNNQKTSLPVSTTVRIVEDRVIADAGPDQLNRTAGQTVTLDGSLSTEPNQQPLEYSWTQVSGPAVTLSDPSDPMPTFTVPPVTDPAGHEFVFELEVTNGLPGEDNTDTDTVSIFSVRSTPTVTVSRTPSGTVFSGDTITLNANITNPDGNSPEEYTYLWTQITGKTTALDDPTSPNPKYSLPANGTNSGACTSGTGAISPTSNNCPRFSVVVTKINTEAASNAANLGTYGSTAPGRPTANAGAPQTVPSSSLVTLNGSGTQAQGRQLEFAWTQTAGPDVELDDPTSPTPTFIAPNSAADLQFQLITTDPLNPIISGSNQKTSLPSVTTVSVGNQPPVANGGGDQGVQVGALVILDGSESFDPDEGDELAFSWEQIVGPEVELNDADTAVANFIAPATPAVLVFELTVSDGKGGIDTDQVTVEAGELDIAAIPYLKYEVNAHKDFTKFQVWVTNNYGPTTTLNIDDIVVSATVNGNPVDSGEFAIIKPLIRNIKAGNTGKYGFYWNHGKGTLRGGDLIELTACVDVPGDANSANDCGTISRPDGTIDLAADTSRTKDIRVKALSSKFKVSLYNVGEIRVPLDYNDVDVSITVNGEPVATPTKVAPIDKLTLLPKMKMVKPPVFKFDEWRYKALHVGLLWDHGQLELGDEIKITACSTVPGDVDSNVPAPPLFEPTEANNCSTATRFVIL